MLQLGDRGISFLRKPLANSVFHACCVKPDSALVYDYSGNGYHAAITDATWVRLPSGLWALDFNGTSAYLEKDMPLLDFTSGDFSAIVRIEWDTLPGVGASRNIIGRGLGAGGGTDGWAFVFGGAGNDLNLSTYQAGTTQTSYNRGGMSQTGVWYTCGFSRSGASVIIAVNGVEGTTSAAVHVDPLTCARTVKIGCTDPKSTFMDAQLQYVEVCARYIPVEEHMYVHKQLEGLMK